jgi:hypothetical protein
METSKLFEAILNERTIAIPQGEELKKYGMITKRLASKGIKIIFLGDDAGENPRDVHGIPPGFKAYGRGGVFPNGSLFMEGGYQGSKSGHPGNIQNGFYWGLQGNKLYVRGRAGVTEEFLESIRTPIFEWIGKHGL